jgi:hypothetical protein
MRKLTAGLALLIALPLVLHAQRPLAPVRGTVVDSAGHPIESVEVTATGVGRATRTNSEGRFQIDTLVVGPNRLLVRRLGWKAIDTTFMLYAKNPLELHLVMSRLAQTLEEVRIVSHDDCPIRTLEGFQCRRRAGLGAFRDSAELAALNPTCYANMAEGMEGVRVVYRGDSPCPTLESTKGWRCLRTLVDGRLAPVGGGLRMSDYIGIEFYDEEDKVPEWYKRWAFANATSGTKTYSPPGLPTVYGRAGMPGRPCALLVVWTHFAPRFDPKLDQNKNATRAMKSRRDSLAALQKAIVDSLKALKKP